MARKSKVLKLTHITTVPVSLMFLRGQIGYMQDRGFGVDAISSPGLELTEFGESEGIKVYAVEMPRSITPLHDLRAGYQLFRTFRHIKPTIAHAHTPKGGLLGMITGWLARTPVRIYHIRGLPYMSASGRRRTLLKATEQISCMLANRVFCVSHSIRNVAIADGICPPEKIVVFAGGSGNGVDANGQFSIDRFTEQDVSNKRSELGIQRDEVVIGFVGRIVRSKGIEELTQAWQRLRISHPKARLLLVGHIEPQDPVSEVAISLLQNDPRVTITGWIEDPGAFYPLFDVLVLPTYREGFPNVPLEAAAMGKPVVATQIPGCIDAVEDGVTGTLVPAQDPDSLGFAIQVYLDNPELRQKHGQAGWERVLRDFRQEVIWEEIYQEYCRLLREKGLPVPVPLAPSQ